MIKMSNLCNNSGIRWLRDFILNWHVCEGTHKAIYRSGHFGSELTENIQQFLEKKIYGTLKHQDNQGGIANEYQAYLPEKKWC